MTLKAELHPRNRHNQPYDFPHLIEAFPPLEAFVGRNKYGTLSVDFFNPQAVKALNGALLAHHYGILHWDLPPHYLCPPIPGRADYIHYLADLLEADPVEQVRCLDVGVGANCIYPIIGCVEYGWSFVGADIDAVALENARQIVDQNPALSGRVELRRQDDPQSIFCGIIQPDDFFHATLCNPPFHSSMEQARRGTLRKLTNLKGHRINKASLNFGGQSNELWCAGGELRFLQDMISQSRLFQKNCRWFTSLVSKEENLEPLYAKLKATGVAQYRTIEMRQGQKSSRILAWRY